MSAREPYGPGSSLGAAGTRSPRGTRRIATELPTVDRSPSRSYPSGGGGGGGQRNSPVGRRTVRPGAGSPDHHGGPYQTGIGGGGGGGLGIGGGGGGASSSSYYRDDDLNSPVLLDDRGRAMVGSGPGASHRSRSASRPTDRMGVMPSSRYQSLDRNAGVGGGGGGGILSDSGGQYGHDRDYRSFDRDRGYGTGFSGLDDDPYGTASSRSRQSPGGGGGGVGVGGHFMSNARDTGHFLGELQHQNTDLHRELSNLKKELELTNQKLGSSMHSIKTFWSPELKKERALRKEESAKYSLINDQLKLLHSENQKQSMLVRQLEEELRMRMRGPNMELQQQVELLLNENDHLTREVAILRETIKELELRIETQKQTLQSRDESIKKLLDMLQNKGVGGKVVEAIELEARQVDLEARLLENENLVHHFQSVIRNRDQELNSTKRDLKATNDNLKALQMELEKAYQTQNVGVSSSGTLTAILETKDARIATLEKEVGLLEQELDRMRLYAGSSGHVLDRSVQFAVAPAFKHQLEEFRSEIQRRDQEIVAMSAKMKTLEEQHTDYQRHIGVLKESLSAKEEHYTMLQADVEELRSRLEEKNRVIEKKTQTALQATQEKNRVTSEINELKDHVDIKDRKINVLQRKLELQEAQKKAQVTSSKSNEETISLKAQLEEQKRQLEAQRRQLEELRKSVDGRSRQLEEKEKHVAELDGKLKKRKENLDLLESQINRSKSQAGDSDVLKRLQSQVESLQKELDKSKEEASRSQTDMERLLQVVQMGQEEQNAKEKQIRELQEALKNLQSKARGPSSQQQQHQHQQQQQQQQPHPSRQPKKDDENVDRPGEAVDVASETEARFAEELEELLDVIQMKNDHIEELQEALKESVTMISEREDELFGEQIRRKDVQDQVCKLEERLSLAENQCKNCRGLYKRLEALEEQLFGLQSERRTKLQELSTLRQEALESAISEKDAHIALLEFGGARSAKRTGAVDELKADRTRLIERLHRETETAVELLQEAANAKNNNY